MNVNENRCAKYCLLARPTECSFYYFVVIAQGPNICQLGRFNQDATQDDHYPGIDQTTEYKFRNDISSLTNFGKLTNSHLNPFLGMETLAQDVYVSTIGDPECKELGYHKLESGKSVTIST